jgi:hypothetical protein
MNTAIVEPDARVVPPAEWTGGYVHFFDRSLWNEYRHFFFA